MPDIALLILGAVLGGLVNGLSGGGFGIIALGLWLMVLPPNMAGPLVVMAIIGANAQALPRIWPHIDLRRTAPFVAGGVFGVPVGVIMLGVISVTAFKLTIAFAIFAFLLAALVLGPRLRLPQKAERVNALIGGIGGMAGGLAGMAGVPLTIWATLLHWDKATKRGVFQSFNLTMAVLSFFSLLWAGFITIELLRLALFVVPTSIASAWVGVRIYERLGEAQFKGLILAILAASGVSILLSLFW